MTFLGICQIFFFISLILLIAQPLGLYIYNVLEGNNTLFSGILRPCEMLIYRLANIDFCEEMNWLKYTQCVIAFSLVSMLLTYLLLIFQNLLPLNPMHFGLSDAPAYATKMTPDLAFNTAISFTTNTNWQSYAGETTMTYLSQMLALAFHNFVSSATGIAVAIAVIRGFIANRVGTIGNFWTDLTRITIYILLPICIPLALLLVSQGVVQNLNPYLTFTTLDNHNQTLSFGLVASQEAIKNLGTNGGGFFNANSAHPFENPTPLTNLLEMLSIFIIPAALTYTFGKMVKDTRQGVALLTVMTIIFLIGTLVTYHFEAKGNPNFKPYNINYATNQLGDSGGNMEGKELRFGIANSSLFAVVTTDTSCGAVNCLHDCLTPMGGLITLLNIELGEVVFGGTGSGLYGIIVFAVLSVFIAGLMVGRTPEYLGKKIEKKEVKMAMLFILIAAFSILVFTAIASVINFPKDSFWNSFGSGTNNLNNVGPHGFSELLYAFSSCTGNNGSAFAGLSANTPFYNILLGIAMFLGRFFMIIPVLAMAGSLSEKKLVPASIGTFPTYSYLFVILLISVILIVGALTFFPALCLGPIIEEFLMRQGKLF